MELSLTAERTEHHAEFAFPADAQPVVEFSGGTRDMVGLRAERARAVWTNTAMGWTLQKVTLLGSVVWSEEVSAPKTRISGCEVAYRTHGGLNGLWGSDAPQALKDAIGVHWAKIDHEME